MKKLTLALTAILIASILVTSVAALKMSGKPTPFRSAPWVDNMDEQCWTRVGVNDPTDPDQPCGYHNLQITGMHSYGAFPIESKRSNRIDTFIQPNANVSSEPVMRISSSGMSIKGMLGALWAQKRAYEDYRWHGTQTYDNFVPS